MTAEVHFAYLRSDEARGRMPKRGKLEKRDRNRTLIRGIRKHRKVFDEAGVGPERLNSDALIARFEAHSHLLDEIDGHEAAKRDAVARERRMEPEIRELRELVLLRISGHYGEAAVENEDFGKKRKQPPRLSIATKAAAVAKRKATRKARNTMGPKQRKKIKGY